MCLQDAEGEDDEQHGFLAGWEVQRADDWDGHREDGKVGHDVDAGHNVPDGSAVETEALHVGIPKGIDGDAGQGEQKAQRDAPAYEEAEAEEDELSKGRVGEDAPVLQQDRDLGQTDGDVVYDDGAVKGLFAVRVFFCPRGHGSLLMEAYLHVRNVILRGHHPHVAAEPVLGLCSLSATEEF